MAASAIAGPIGYNDAMSIGDKKKPLAVVVIPTYNETDNIKKLIPLLFGDTFGRIPDWTIDVLVVDGDSPDGTADIVRDFARTYSGLFLVKENGKNGIGSAYLQGFDYAVRQLKADVVIEFDSDFQHPLSTIKTLLQKIDDGYDYVLGSRNIAGGSEPEGRNRLRTFFTDVGGFLARLILFFPSKYFYSVTDPTTGLKATRVKGCLDHLGLSEAHLYSKKFGYKVQLLSETLATGAKYSEIPLNFDNRYAGISKFEKGTAFDILSSCLRTRLHSKL